MLVTPYKVEAAGRSPAVSPNIGGKSPPTRILRQSACGLQRSEWRLLLSLIRHFLGCYPTRRFIPARRLVEAGLPPKGHFAFSMSGRIHVLSRNAFLGE